MCETSLSELTIPTWSDKDLPPIPSQEQSAVKELQGECQQMLAEYPTTSEQDQEILAPSSTISLLHANMFNNILLILGKNQNPWDVIQFSGNARIHLESFLSIFNISGLPEEYYYNSGGGGGSFVDGAVLAAARTIPAWSDKDLPPIPSQEQSAVKELQGQCQQMLAEYPTTSEQDQEILETMPESGRSFEAAIKEGSKLPKVVELAGISKDGLTFGFHRRRREWSSKKRS
ncbi:hypothetical protein QQ045_002142 [Rhodiola kirilowii]